MGSVIVVHTMYEGILMEWQMENEYSVGDIEMASVRAKGSMMMRIGWLVVLY